MEIVVNYNKDKNEFQIYESSSKTVLCSETLGDGFSGLNSFLKSEGYIKDDIINVDNIIYHFDSATFKEIIKSNMNLLKRVSDIPSEFKNSANKFGMPSVPKNINSKNKQTFNKGKESNFKKGRFSNFTGSAFSDSFGKFGKTGRK